MQLVEVEVQHVELRGHFTDLVQHGHVVGKGIAHASIEAQRLRAASNELCAREGVAAGEQSYTMPLGDEFLGKIGDYSFGAAVESRWHTLDERCDLSDF